MANDPFGGVPPGDIRVETPDGIIFTEGDRTTSNLYNTADRRPAIQSGDWQRYQPAVRPRDRGPGAS